MTPQLIKDAGHRGIICAAANTSLVFIIVTTTGQKVGDETAFEIQISSAAELVK